jgi:Secretion system C-terminal sorting domain
MKKIYTLFMLLLGFVYTGAAQTQNITFQVDMTNVTGFTTPEVNGTFNNWCGSCAAMTDANGDNIWEIVISLAPGFYEYKFSHDNWTGQENLVPGSSCTMTTGQYTNRTLTVGNTDITLDPVCWGSCVACGQSSGPYLITFQVDMSLSGATFTTPEVNGTFNNWCGGCAPMSDSNGDNIWDLSIALNPGSYEYKFAYDTWAGQEALTEGTPCTVSAGGFTNRSLTVTQNDTIPVVCWGSCEACIDFVSNNYVNTLEVYPNPVQTTLKISGVERGIREVICNSVLGKQINLEFNQNELTVGNLQSGFYFLTVIDNGGKQYQTTFVKN